MHFFIIPIHLFLVLHPLTPTPNSRVVQFDGRETKSSSVVSPCCALCSFLQSVTPYVLSGSMIPWTYLFLLVSLTCTVFLLALQLLELRWEPDVVNDRLQQRDLGHSCPMCCTNLHQSVQYLNLNYYYYYYYYLN